MTFAQFVTAVTAQVFPQGEAKNLKAVHKNWIRDGLIEIQQRVLCQQAKQFDYILQNATFWNCGCSVFEAQRGFILGLKTIAVDNICDEVRYQPSTKDEIQCLIKEDQCNAALSNCGCPTGQAEPEQYCGPYFDYGYALGHRYASSTNDQQCRARSGVFALDDGFIWMHPAMRSDEIAVLNWRGIKRDWNDHDPVVFDREIHRATELYLEAESNRVENCDPQKYALAKQAYDTKVADLIWQCKKERRLPKPAPCFANCDCWYHCSGKPAAPPSCTGGISYYYGAESPEGVVDAAKGSVYVQVSPAGAGVLWLKTTTSGNTGWV